MAETDKITRILTLYSQLLSGKKVNKNNFCLDYGIKRRSFDRDIEDIRLFLSESYSFDELSYSRKDNSYQLNRVGDKKLSGEETVVLASALVSLKTFRKDELEELLKNLIEITDRQYRSSVYHIIKNKFDSYKRIKTDQTSLKIQWDIERCILNRKIITMNYRKANGDFVKRQVKPMEILYDDGYAYLVAYRCDEEYEYPAYFRLDRIDSFKVERGEFEDKEFEDYKKLNVRNYQKYMQAGEMMNITLKCDASKKINVEDSFRETKIIDETDDGCVIQIKSFERGLLQWLLGQGESVEILEPPALREKIRQTANTLRKIYEEDENGKND